jgi:hypothetical protein
VYSRAVRRVCLLAWFCVACAARQSSRSLSRGASQSDGGLARQELHMPFFTFLCWFIGQFLGDIDPIVDDIDPIVD